MILRITCDSVISGVRLSVFTIATYRFESQLAEKQKVHDVYNMVGIKFTTGSMLAKCNILVYY